MDRPRRPGFGRQPPGAYPPSGGLGPPSMGGCGGNRPVSASRRKGIEPPSSSLWAKAGGSGGLTRQVSAPTLAPSGGHNMSFDTFARSPGQNTSYESLARGTSMRRALSAASVGPARSGTPSGQRPGLSGTSSVPRRRPYDHGPPPSVYATPERGSGNSYQLHRATALQLESRLTEHLREQSIGSGDPGRRPPVPEQRNRPGSRGKAQTGSPWVNDSYSHASFQQPSFLDRERDRRTNTPSPGHASWHNASPWPERRPLQQPPAMPVDQQQPPEAHYGRPPPPAQSSFHHYEGASGLPSQHSLGPDESGIMPESRLQIYSDLFEEVIDRDRVFGSLLRKIKTAYDSLLARGVGQQEIPPMPHDERLMGGLPSGPPGRGDSSWAPDLSSTELYRQPYGAAHSNEPTRRAEAGEGWEMHRENRVLKDLVERLHLELEEAVKREHRWKQKVAKLKSRGDSVGPSRPESTGNTPQQMQAYGHGQQDPWTSMGYPKEMMPEFESTLSATDAQKMATGMPGPNVPKFNAMRREPGLPQDGDPGQDGALNQGGLLSLSSISPQASANPGVESMEYDADTARSTDSGMLPQRPERRNIMKPAHVPRLDLSLLKQNEEEEEEDEEEGEGAHMDEDEDHDMHGDPHGNLWSVELAFGLGSKIGRPDNGMIQRLDVSQYASITKAVDALNKGIISCAEGLCIVYSNSNQMYFLLVRADREEDGIKLAREVFNIEVDQEDCSEDEFAPSGHDENDPAACGMLSLDPHAGSLPQRIY